MNLIPPFFRKKSLINTRDVGVIDNSWDIGWWQQGKSPVGGGGNAIVEACVQRIATAISSMPINHYNILEDGTRVRVKNSNPLKVLRNPNPLMNQVEFLYNGLRSLYLNGNMYAYLVRNNRTEIAEMWLLDSNSVHAYRIPDTGDVVYSIGDTRYTPENFDPTYFVPSRDMMHIKLATSSDPLRGDSPVASAYAQITANNAIADKSANFFKNQGIPSGVIQTEQSLNREQTQKLREAWDEQSKGLNSGRTPILANGLKWQQVTMSSQDAQLVQANAMTVQGITAVFGVPLALVNSMDNATYSNTEQLISHWLATGLGFTVSLIETAFERSFECDIDEKIDFDEKILLRANFKDRVDALGNAVLHGIYSPNEARRIEGLAPVDGGEKPFLQQQQIQIGESPLANQQPAQQTPPPEPKAPAENKDPQQIKNIMKTFLMGKMTRND